MVLNPKDRIAEIQGRSGTYRTKQKSPRNSRVAQADLIAGTYSDKDELVSSDMLMNIREYQPAEAVSRTIRVSGKWYERLAKMAKPFETPAATLERLMPLDEVDE